MRKEGRRSDSATGPAEPGVTGIAQGLGEGEAYQHWGHWAGSTSLLTSPVLLTLCPLTWAQRAQDLLVILRDVQP